MHKDTTKHCNVHIFKGESTGIYRLKTALYVLADMPADFQKARDYTVLGLKNTFCFLDDIIVVNTGSESKHINYVTKCLKKLVNSELEWLRYNSFKQEFCHQKAQQLLLCHAHYDHSPKTLLNPFGLNYTTISLSLLPTKKHKVLKSVIIILN